MVLIWLLDYRGDFLHKKIFKCSMFLCTEKQNMKLNNSLKCVSVCMNVSETAVLSLNITNNKNGSKNSKYFSEVDL